MAIGSCERLFKHGDHTTIIRTMQGWESRETTSLVGGRRRVSACTTRRVPSRVHGGRVDNQS
jgi:hypothetical protein